MTDVTAVADERDIVTADQPEGSARAAYAKPVLRRLGLLRRLTRFTF